MFTITTKSGWIKINAPSTEVQQFRAALHTAGFTHRGRHSWARAIRSTGRACWVPTQSEACRIIDATAAKLGYKEV